MSIKWIRLSVFDVHKQKQAYLNVCCPFFKKDFALIFAFKVPINVFIIGIVVNLFNPQIEKQL